MYPLWDRLRTELRAPPVAQADETPCHVQKDGRAANAKSFLEGFSGVLVSDAFSGYHALESRRPEIRVAHCWARARRDFSDALKAFKRPAPPNSA